MILGTCFSMTGPAAGIMDSMKQAMKGVNLGGWLVLEKWMTPSLFAGTDAVDEYTFCETADAKRLKALEKFRRSWIAEDDFRWLRANGVEAVRVPVGYWAFGDQPPYAKTIGYLDQAFAWAEKYDIKVLVCLHGAPGSQNGKDHSGRVGDIGWGQDDSIGQTLEVLERLVARYHDKTVLLGFELLNEPLMTLSKRLLKQYYKQAYRLIRRKCGPLPWIVFSDAFRLRRWSWSLHRPLYQGAYLDTHQYQVFTEHDRSLDLAGHLAKTSRIGRSLRWLGWHRRYIVGEWSAALDDRSLAGLDGIARQDALQRFMVAQAAAYRTADAWFYWSYKTEAGDAWSYRDMVRSGRPQDG